MTVNADKRALVRFKHLKTGYYYLVLTHDVDTLRSTPARFNRFLGRSVRLLTLWHSDAHLQHWEWKVTRYPTYEKAKYAFDRLMVDIDQRAFILNHIRIRPAIA